MNIDQVGTSHNVELNIEETLELISKLSCAAAHAMKHNYSVVSMPCILAEDDRLLTGSVVFTVRG